MHSVRKCIVLFGPAGGIIPQHFGGVQKFVAVLLAHCHKRGVVRIYLGHGQVGVVPLLVQRGNGADDNIRIGPCFGDGGQPLPVLRDELGGIRGAATKVVGAETNDNAFGLQLGNGIRNGVQGAVPLELFAFQGGDGTGPHADHANVVFQRGKRRSGVIGVHGVAHGVGIPNEQGVVHITAPGICCLRQNSGHGGICLGGGGGGLNNGGSWGSRGGCFRRGGMIGQNIPRLAAGTQRSTQRRRSQNFTPIRAFHAFISFLIFFYDTPNQAPL